MIAFGRGNVPGDQGLSEAEFRVAARAPGAAVNQLLLEADRHSAAGAAGVEHDWTLATLLKRAASHGYG